MKSQEIEEIANGIEAWWRKKHPDYKPFHTGGKIDRDDQWDTLHYGECESCVIKRMTKMGVATMQPDARALPRPLYLEEQDVLSRLYDERTL